KCKTLSRREKCSGLTRRDNCSSESPCVNSAARSGVSDNVSIASDKKLIFHLLHQKAASFEPRVVSPPWLHHLTTRPEICNPKSEIFRPPPLRVPFGATSQAPTRRRCSVR